MRCSILSSILLAATALAAPGPIGARQNAVTCGNNVGLALKLSMHAL